MGQFWPVLGSKSNQKLKFCFFKAFGFNFSVSTRGLLFFFFGLPFGLEIFGKKNDPK